MSNLRKTFEEVATIWSIANDLVNALELIEEFQRSFMAISTFEYVVDLVFEIYLYVKV